MTAFFMPRLFCLLAAALLFAVSGNGTAADGPRIISLYAAHTEVLLRLGARDNIVGVSRQETYKGPETDGWNPPTFSFRDDVEKFLAAKPDIVLARPQHVAGGGHLKEALSRAGIAVQAMQVTQADELYDYWRMLGGLVGKEKEAQEMIAAFSLEVERHRIAAAKIAKKPGVFIEAIHREVKTFTPGSLPVWLVELAGGRNVAADAKPAMPGVVIAEFGPERLLERAEDIDIFISQEGVMNRATLDEIKTRTIYQPLKAVRNGRVYQIPEAVFARPTPSLLDGLKIVAGFLGSH